MLFAQLPPASMAVAHEMPVEQDAVKAHAVLDLASETPQTGSGLKFTLVRC